jgi:hypothetical protein
VIHRIKGIILAAAIALGATLGTQGQEQPESICGREFIGDGYSLHVSCVDMDELAKLTGAPISGKMTQILVTPSNQDAYGVAVVAVGADGKLLKAEPIYIQPDGLKKAMVIFTGFGWQIEHVQIIAK